MILSRRFPTPCIDAIEDLIEVLSKINDFEDWFLGSIEKTQVSKFTTFSARGNRLFRDDVWSGSLCWLVCCPLIPFFCLTNL